MEMELHICGQQKKTAAMAAIEVQNKIKKEQPMPSKRCLH